MSKPLRSMSDHERIRTILRRLSEKKGGLGYWAAVDAEKKGGVTHGH
jgi:hypothetical protein